MCHRQRREVRKHGHTNRLLNLILSVFENYRITTDLFFKGPV